MLLWYAAYGSNLDRDRFEVYLGGGRAPGAQHANPGCRDATPPVDVRLLRLRGGLRFGWDSLTWGGGVAFFDAEVDSTVLARGYLVTAQQFSDVTSQEMWQEPGRDLDLTDVMTHGRQAVGPGCYETIHHVGEVDGHPVLTFTAPDPVALGATRPTEPYLMTMLRGLTGPHGLTPEEAAEYLASWPGAEDWTASQIAGLATLALEEVSS